MKLSAYKIARMKILRGLTGKILTDADHIRQLICRPGLFKTYQLIENEITKQPTHTIELEEIEVWNKAILEKISTQKQAIKEAKKTF